MIGKIFITSSGYDPQLGKHVKDPYLGDNPSLGACRPDFRGRVEKGDHLYIISGKLPNVRQYVIGGFEVAEKITANEAYQRFPEQRLRLLPDGQVAGNIIVDSAGKQHALDTHPKGTFDRRIQNYLVGKNCLALISPEEITKGREQTLEALREILKKQGDSVWQIVGHWGSELTENQILQLRAWLESLKKPANDEF